MGWLTSSIQRVARRLGLVLLRESSFAELKNKENIARKYGILSLLANGQHKVVFNENWERSKAQLGQDVLALVISGFKRGGYFVEFGATDGITLSNTYLLESEHAWTGVLAEPGKQWLAELKASRSVQVVNKAVFSSSDLNLDFIEDGELSTISTFKSSDHHNRSGRTYPVETISLSDLLLQANAPKFIDFMSIDTEGSEFEILENFVFEDYEFGLITIEHNFTEAQGKLDSLLSSKGYRRILQDVSEWDAWYIRA